MKLLTALFLSIACVGSAHAQEKPITARADMAQEKLRRGETHDGWKFAKGGQALFRNKRIGEPVRGEFVELRFSKGSNNGAFRYVLWWDVDRGVAQALIWDNAAQSVKAMFPALPEQQWDGVFWSPGGKYAVVPQAGEVQEAVYVANLATGHVRKRNVVVRALKPCENQALVDQPATWKGDSTFRLNVRIAENPWHEGGAKCKPKPRTVPFDVPME